MQVSIQYILHKQTDIVQLTSDALTHTYFHTLTYIYTHEVTHNDTPCTCTPLNPRSHVIENLQTDSKQHLHDTQKNGHLHLVRVDEDQLILGHIPDRVQSKWVGGHTFHSLAGDLSEMTPRRKLDTRRVWTVPEYVTSRLTAKKESLK